MLKTETVSGTLSSVEIKNPFGTFWPGSVKWDTLYNSGKQNRFGKGQCAQCTLSVEHSDLFKCSAEILIKFNSHIMCLKQNVLLMGKKQHVKAFLAVFLKAVSCLGRKKMHNYGNFPTWNRCNQIWQQRSAGPSSHFFMKQDCCLYQIVKLSFD